MFQMLFLVENTSAAGRRDLLRYLKALDPTVFPDGGGQSDRVCNYIFQKLIQ